jgi:hypothetical protein
LELWHEGEIQGFTGRGLRGGLEDAGGRAAIPRDSVAIVTLLSLLNEAIAADGLRSNHGRNFAETRRGAAIAGDCVAIVTLFTEIEAAIAADRRDTVAVDTRVGGIDAGDGSLTLLGEFEETVAAER